jgi:hypothetical protein
MKQQVMIMAALAACASLWGCGNVDRVVFVTQTQVGVGGDIATSTAHVGFDRTEAFIGPDYPEHGGLPPVAASLQSDLAFLAPNVKQLYATGDAALIASRRIAAPATISRNDAGLSAAEKCSLNLGCSWAVPEDRRLSIVASNTHVGLVVKLKDGQLTTVDFGYGRQEASMLPLRKEQGADIYPSALAAISVVTSTGDGKSLGSGAGLKASQFIATGAAADKLAGTDDVQRAFKLAAAGAAQDQANSLVSSLGYTDDQIAERTKQAKADVTTVKQDAAAYVQKLLGVAPEDDRALTADDKTRIGTATARLAGDVSDTATLRGKATDLAGKASSAADLRRTLTNNPELLYALKSS